MGLFRDNETNNSNGKLHGEEAQLIGGEPRWLFYNRG